MKLRVFMGLVSINRFVCLAYKRKGRRYYWDAEYAKSFGLTPVSEDVSGGCPSPLICIGWKRRKGLYEYHELPKKVFAKCCVLKMEKAGE